MSATRLAQWRLGDVCTCLMKDLNHMWNFWIMGEKHVKRKGKQQHCRKKGRRVLLKSNVRCVSGASICIKLPWSSMLKGDSKTTRRSRSINKPNKHWLLIDLLATIQKLHFTFRFCIVMYFLRKSWSLLINTSWTSTVSLLRFAPASPQSALKAMHDEEEAWPSRDVHACKVYMHGSYQGILQEYLLISHVFLQPMKVQSNYITCRVWVQRRFRADNSSCKATCKQPPVTRACTCGMEVVPFMIGLPQWICRNRLFCTSKCIFPLKLLHDVPMCT